MATLLDFHAEWCGPCSQQDPIVDDLEDEYDEDDLGVERIDVDENQQRANEYQVRSLPTLVVLDEDDDVVDRFVGFTEKETLEESIDTAI